MVLNSLRAWWLILATSALLSAPAGAARAPSGPPAGYERISRGVTVVYYQPQDHQFAGLYLDWLGAYRPRPDWLPASAMRRLEIVIAPTQREFDILSGGSLPEWGVACALTELDRIIVRSPRIVELWRENPREVLLHEAAHIYLDQFLEPADVPRWFHEGYAMYAGEMWDLGSSLEYSVALLVGRIFPLESINEGFPAPEKLARRAYLQSFTVVEYMFQRWSREQLTLLFQRWRERGDLDRALRASLGLTLGQLEEDWLGWVEVRYGWLRLLTSVTLIWLLAAVLFIGVYVRKRRSYHQRLEEMRSGESDFWPPGHEYWYDDPEVAWPAHEEEPGDKGDSAMPGKPDQ